MVRQSFPQKSIGLPGRSNSTLESGDLAKTLPLGSYTPQDGSQHSEIIQKSKRKIRQKCYEFPCDLCNQTFRLNSSLKRHKRTGQCPSINGNIAENNQKLLHEFKCTNEGHPGLYSSVPNNRALRINV